MGGKLQLYFGLQADGRTYPDTTTPIGDLDVAVVGPAGLVATLEVQIGLLGPVASRATRIAAYLSKLRSTGGTPRFWRESFAKDAWSTAAAVLMWRDALVAGGWTTGSIGSSRIDDLAAAEAAGSALPPGLVDRAATVTAAVATRPGLRVTRLVLLEAREALPRQWARLVDALEKAGVFIEELPSRSSGVDGTDLRRVQSALSGGEIEPLVGDGSFVMLEADTELMAAEAIADWLAVAPAEEMGETVILSADGDTALLDNALRSRGLPALGLSRPSPWRGALQLLPMAFAVAWRPLDAKALLSLLMLPRPPMPRFAAARLARALTSEPGLDGRAWQLAWDDIRARAEVMCVDDGPRAPAKAQALVEKWRSWTLGARFDRVDGMPVDEVRQIAGRVAAWAVEVDAGAGDSLLLALAGAAGVLVEAVERLELDRVPALLLERIIGQVLADGVRNPAHGPEAGELRSVQAPGSIWGEVTRLIWWSFTGPGERPALLPWSRAELASLEKEGVYLEEPAVTAAQITARYSQVLQWGSGQAILVRSALARSEQTIAHPLSHQLRPILKDASAEVFVRAERLLREPEVLLARRRLIRQETQTTSPPLGRAAWHVPEQALRRLEARRESASSLRRLLTCQMAWMLQDVIGLRPGKFAEIPGPDQLFGNLAHEIARRLLRPGAPPPEATVRAAAGHLFEELLPQMAAPLQRPEFAGELATARDLVPAALEALVRLMHERGLEIVGTELDREGVVGNLALHGRIDLAVRQGVRPAILDLKWTRSERRYRKEIVDGDAVQLAIYHVLGGEGGVGADGAYFLLRQRRVLAGTGSILSNEPLKSARDNAETLQLVEADWSAWRDLTRRGTLLAAGIEGAAAQRPLELGFPAAEKPCQFCELTGLCRVHVEMV